MVVEALVNVKTELPLSPVQHTAAPVLDCGHNIFGNHAQILKTVYTKGTAFSIHERQKFGLEGFLPVQVEELEVQVERNYEQLNTFSQPISKYHYLSALRERNETVFYALTKQHITEVLPIIYTPTVGEVCSNFGHNYRQVEGMYITLNDKVERVLNNWNPSYGMSKEENTGPSIIVITDGSRILGLGDLGINGMGIPIGKLSLYCAAGGFAPTSLLPIVLDVGTDNQSLLEDKFYMGTRCTRPEAEVYNRFVDKVIDSLSKKWPQAVIQFEDIQTPYCFDFLDKYRLNHRVFNDDIQGTGVVTAAAVMSAMKIMSKSDKVGIMDHKFLFYGFGSASAGVADQILRCIKLLTKSKTEDIINMFYMVDSQGLCTHKRDLSKAPHKKGFARKDDKFPDGLTLKECVTDIKPTFLIGLAAADSGVFNETIVRLMCKNTPKPAIFALSNPTSKAEVLFEDAYSWSEGKVIYCAGSPMKSVGKIQASQCNNLYAFPGIGFGAWLSQCSRITDSMLTAAATSISEMTSDSQLKLGLLFPHMNDVAGVSDNIASAVMLQASKEGVATVHIEEDATARLKFVNEARYVPHYEKRNYKY